MALLVTALHKSLNGIARRRQAIQRSSRGNMRYEFQFAVLSDRGIVHIINGRTGVIRMMQRADQFTDDWEAFQVMPDIRKKRRIKEPKEEGQMEPGKPERMD